MSSTGCQQSSEAKTKQEPLYHKTICDRSFPVLKPVGEPDKKEYDYTTVQRGPRIPGIVRAIGTPRPAPSCSPSSYIATGAQFDTKPMTIFTAHGTPPSDLKIDQREPREITVIIVDDYVDCDYCHNKSRRLINALYYTVPHETLYCDACVPMHVNRCRKVAVVTSSAQDWKG